MTTEAVIHPRILQASANFQNRLMTVDPDADEIVLMARVVIRKGVPRKVKWALETEECYT